MDKWILYYVINEGWRMKAEKDYIERLYDRKRGFYFYPCAGFNTAEDCIGFVTRRFNIKNEQIIKM